MKYSKYVALVVTTLILSWQNKIIAQSEGFSNSVELRDTIYQFVFDSLNHDLGIIDPKIKGTSHVKKYFMYFGNEPMLISRAWTGDPHFICDYPKEPLEKGKLYSFTICFYHQGRGGILKKRMGFTLMNGNRITMNFKGNYKKIETNNKQ